MFLFFDAKYERTIADARHGKVLGLKQRDTASSQKMNYFFHPTPLVVSTTSSSSIVADRNASQKVPPAASFQTTSTNKAF